MQSNFFKFQIKYFYRIAKLSDSTLLAESGVEH